MKGYFFAVNPGNREEELRCCKGVCGLTVAVATHDKLIFGSSGDVFITCLNPENGEVKWRMLPITNAEMGFKNGLR